MIPSAARIPLGIPAVNYLWLALCTGLSCGLAEGVLRLGFLQLGAFSWNAILVGFSSEILWVAPLVNAVLFLIFGIVLVVAGMVARNLLFFRVALFALAFVAFLGLLLTPGRLGIIAPLVLAAGLASLILRILPAEPSHVVSGARRGAIMLAIVAIALFVGSESTNAWQVRNRLRDLPAADPAAPNILLVVMDTVRADHVSAYGYDRQTTPTFDRLARAGVLFENAFSTSSWSLPSHASLLTGRYPSQIENVRQHFECKCPTLPGVLTARGYRTGAISANTFIFNSAKRFSSVFNYFEDNVGTPQSWTVRTTLGRLIFSRVAHVLGYRNLPGRVGAADVNRAALGWLDNTAGRPFFLMVNYFDAHDPYLPPAQFTSKWASGERVGGALNSFVGQPKAPLPAKVLQSELTAYDGAIALVDDSIGTLLSEMEKRQVLENTIVVITADHGEAFGEHGTYGHGESLFVEETRVPMLMYWKGHTPVGLRVSTPVSNAAIPATALDFLGAPERPFAISSLLPEFDVTEPRAERDLPLSELLPTLFGGRRVKPPLRSLIDRRWHFIMDRQGAFELYDWQADPRETTDLSGVAEHQPIVQSFRERMAKIPDGTWTAQKP